MGIVIVSAADERFVPHFATMLHSAWTHHPDAQFYLLDCGIDPMTLSALSDYANERVIRLTIIKIDTEPFCDLPTTKNYSLAIYARLLIPTLLPETIERVIYLDADCVVVSNLAQLWQMDMDIAAIAGVRDIWGADVERHIGFYVNSGVLVMNLSVWRRHHIADKVLAVIRQRRLRLPDQTAINAVCIGKIILLSDSWNFMVGAGWRRLRDWRTPPRIIHFTGAGKPWLYRDALFGAIYLHHRNQTPFAITPPRAVHRSLLRRLANLIIGRRKYWHRLITSQCSQTFVDNYLACWALKGSSHG